MEGQGAKYNFNLEKIAPLCRAKCNSEEIGKKKKKNSFNR